MSQKGVGGKGFRRGFKKKVSVPPKQLEAKFDMADYEDEEDYDDD